MEQGDIWRKIATFGCLKPHIPGSQICLPIPVYIALNLNRIPLTLTSPVGIGNPTSLSRVDRPSQRVIATRRNINIRIYIFISLFIWWRHHMVSSRKYYPRIARRIKIGVSLTQILRLISKAIILANNPTDWPRIRPCIFVIWHPPPGHH